MRYGWKKVSVIFLLGCLLMNGCSSEGQNRQGDPNNSTQVQVNESEDYKVDGNVSVDDNNDPQITEDQAQMKSVKIYTVENDIPMDKNVGVPADIEVTPEYIVQMTANELKDQSYVIKVNEVKEEDNNVVVDFNASAPPVLDIGKETENAILDAIALSILDNIQECIGVIYRVDGQAYVSSNNSFEYNKAYMMRKY